DLHNPQSLIAVSCGDGGALPTIGGAHDFDPRFKDFDIAAVEKSIAGRRADSHNEWGVQDYVLRGLFVLENPVVVIQPNDEQRTISIRELQEIFPEQRIYGFQEGTLVEHHPRGQVISAIHTEIYRT